MHVPSEMLTGSVCPVTVAVSLSVVLLAGLSLLKKHQDHLIKRFILVSALIFCGQMLNFHIASDVSGHLIGGVLAAACLGIPAAILSISLVLVVQSFLFADGGDLAANVLNMAIVGAGLGGLLRLGLKCYIGEHLATFVAAASSVLLAVLILSVELLASFQTEQNLCLSLLKAHFIIALFEGAITVALLAVISEKNAIKSLAALLMTAICCTPLASHLPDAFEKVMRNAGLFVEETQQAPFAGYLVTGINNGYLATSLAALIGVLAIAGVASGVTFMTNLRRR